jgi:fatty-acyl-CoA synthase
LASAPDDVAFLQPTSGTSGEPRAAVILQRNALASLESARALIDPSPRDVLVGWVPPWHDLGLLRFLLGPIYFGVPCHLVPPAIRTIPQWLATIGAVRGTITGAPDFAYRLATRLVKEADLSSLRYATNGGEPVRWSTISAFSRAFDVHDVIRPGYGLAEATLGVTCVRVGEALQCDARGNVATGRPLDGIEVRIDPHDGEILVRGAAVFAGYFDAPEESAEALRDGWLHTGDVGNLDEHGNLYVLGRRRAMLKRGGAALAPRELEEAAQMVPGVRIAAAVGIPGSATEELVVVVEAEHHDVATLVSEAVERAIGFAPDRVVVQPPRTIPRTANGKIRHAALRNQLVERGSA